MGNELGAILTTAGEAAFRASLASAVRARSEGEHSVSCVMVQVASVAVAATPRSGLAGRSGRSRTVLVVEDEWLVLELATEVLEAEGHRVLGAADAKEALLLLRSEPIDLLFTDIDLASGTDGLTLAREARRLRPDLRVAYASGRRPDLRADDMVPGSVFLPKPYRLAEIVDLPLRLPAP